MIVFSLALAQSAFILPMVLFLCGNKKDNNKEKPSEATQKPAKKADSVSLNSERKPEPEKKAPVPPPVVQKKDSEKEKPQPPVEKSKPSELEKINEKELDKTQMASVKVVSKLSQMKDAKSKKGTKSKKGDAASNMSEIDKPADPVEQDAGYENVPDMTPEELEKIAKATK